MLESIKVYASDGDPFSKIAFISQQGQNEALHVIDPVTTEENLFHLSSPSRTWASPGWSFQCDRILISRDENGQNAINVFAYGADSILTTLPGIVLQELLAYSPRWSPDGSTIAFQGMDREPFGNNLNIYTLSVSTGELKNLTHDAIPNTQPNWSSNGQQIVFTATPKNNIQEYSDIYVVDTDGSSPKAIYSDPETNDWSPMWSPDGRSIAFVSQTSEGNQLMLMDKYGDTSISLTDNGVYKILDSAWSNTGKYIVFSSYNAYDDTQILLLNVRSKSVEPLTDAPKTINQIASWSPDDRQLVFQSNRDGDFEIYTLNLATKELNQLTDNHYDDIYPIWSPKSCYEN
jgi:TolB protein